MADMPGKIPSRTYVVARRKRASTKVAPNAAVCRADIGLALAGGGPLGVTYEVGALNALAEALDGIDFNGLGVYVGVSAGSVLASALANGIAPREICRLFIEVEPAGSSLEAFDPATLLQPATHEYRRRLAALPRIGAHALRSFWANPEGNGWSAAIARLGPLLRAGLFDNSNIDRYLRQLFGMPGRTNDFRKLRRRLCEHTYQRTRADLLARSDTLAPIFARHGITLRVDLLRDASRTLVPGPPARNHPAPAVVHDLEAAIASLAAWLRPQSALLAS